METAQTAPKTSAAPERHVFTVNVRPARRGTEADLLGDERVTIAVEPGALSMGFPVLYVAGWVKDPQIFAEKVATLLTEHGQ